MFDVRCSVFTISIPNTTPLPCLSRGGLGEVWYHSRRAYCRNGVHEYLVWLVAEARLEWFCLEDDDYRPQLPDAQAVLHSRIFPGLRLPVAPFLAGDTAKVLAALSGHELLNKKPV